MHRELPHARIAGDRFHLVALGNQLVIKVRLRMLLDSGTDESLAAHRLWLLQTIAADSGPPEAATRAGSMSCTDSCSP